MAASTEIDPLDLEIQSLTENNRRNWTEFSASHEDELKTASWEIPHMRIIQKMFILSAHLCEAGNAVTSNALGTILKALELKPHPEFAGLFPNWSPQTSMEQISSDLQFREPKGLGMNIYNHLNQKVNSAVSKRMAAIALFRN